jgi:hypothetical protein
MDRQEEVEEIDRQNEKRINPEDIVININYEISPSIFKQSLKDST